ncbi:GNAT family N-acetyltransferase [Viridibacillus sp. YIM B01967]|uniref:GNAT family N-acetyltransferase n=1 Tax=Viridibacillus soli TaxID=2798301 RepID=A0ABS1HBS8_9BACL|nr:GNAT family N-acetyltransferase [Viridibacillus soli]MBK3496870.1 GNAT family N-acetyltransferase [Viridibacillus soli]
MIELNTERLRLIPLNAESLKLLIDNQNEMEIKLSLNKSEGVLSKELKHAMEFRLSKVMEDQQNFLWYTNWLIVLREENCIVGGIMLKGRPNENGEVIIGYYTSPEYQGNGYMTEAVSNIKSWLLNQPDVMYVIADTDKANIASHKVLEKTGAEIYKETEDLYFWRFF